MSEKKYRVIGTMSGTSLDGLDISFCEFTYNGGWNFDLLAFSTVPYTDELYEKLKIAETLSEGDLAQLDKKLGIYYGQLINIFIRENILTEIDFIASHGHTVFHEPEKGITLQIGSGSQINKATGIPVINDFRKRDVELGGQGAPLVPIGDKLLFSDYSYCLNLGGIANISYHEKGERKAYDICPVNMALNHLANLLGKPYDQDGMLAASGSLDDNLLRKLSQLGFYHQSPPKSLGKEWFNTEFSPIIEASDASIPSKLRTVVEHAVSIIANAISKDGKVLITGGGAFNSFLINSIKSKLSNEIVLPTKEIIEYKEAIVFGFLGVLKMENQPNCLKSVTGSSEDNIGGVLHDN